MIIFGWLRRGFVLGAKYDECRTCHVLGPHLLVRQTYWFTLFYAPLLLLWVRHAVLCPACGDEERIGMLTMRRALRSRRLSLDRERPAFEKALREQPAEIEPAAWDALDLAPGATEGEIRARYRELSAAHHPDAGGDAAVFVAITGLYQRLLRSTQYQVNPRVDPAEQFDPVLPNRKLGSFDFYATKLWPAAMAPLLVAGGIGLANDRDPATTTVPAPSSSPAITGPTATPPTAHTCWIDGDGLSGCRDDTTTDMLFGTATGTETTCWFVEPLDPGESARCR